MENPRSEIPSMPTDVALPLSDIVAASVESDPALISRKDPPRPGIIGRGLLAGVDFIGRRIPTYTVEDQSGQWVYTGIWRETSAHELADYANVSRGSTHTVVDRLGRTVTRTSLSEL